MFWMKALLLKKVWSTLRNRDQIHELILQDLHLLPKLFRVEVIRYGLAAWPYKTVNLYKQDLSPKEWDSLHKVMGCVNINNTCKYSREEEQRNRYIVFFGTGT